MWIPLIVALSVALSMLPETLQSVKSDLANSHLKRKAEKFLSGFTKKSPTPLLDPNQILKKKPGDLAINERRVCPKNIKSKIFSNSMNSLEIFTNEVCASFLGKIFTIFIENPKDLTNRWR